MNTKAPSSTKFWHCKAQVESFFELPMLKIFEISTSFVRSSSSSAVCAGSERRRQRRLRCRLQRQHQLWSRQIVGICCSAAANTCTSLVSCASCLVLRFGSAVVVAALPLQQWMCHTSPSPAPFHHILPACCSPCVRHSWAAYGLRVSSLSLCPILCESLCLRLAVCLCVCVCF